MGVIKMEKIPLKKLDLGFMDKQITNNLLKITLIEFPLIRLLANER